MAQTVAKHLLFERGRYFYQRRVPKEFAALIDCKKWRAPLGEDREKAIQNCVALTAEHDAFIERLKTPDGLRQFLTTKRHEPERTFDKELQQETARTKVWIEANDLTEQERNEALSKVGSNDFAL